MSSLIMLERVVAMLAILGGQWELATVFGSSTWDRANPHSALACYHRQIDDARDVVVAHNTLPCRSPVLLYNPRTGKATVARVGDRGPRRAGIDLSRLVARRLEHNGRERILVVPLGPPEPGAPTSKAHKPLLVDRVTLRRQLQAAAEAQRIPVEPPTAEAAGGDRKLAVAGTKEAQPVSQTDKQPSTDGLAAPARPERALTAP